MKTVIAKYRLGIESLDDIFRHKFNKMFLGKDKANALKWEKSGKNLRKKYFKNGIWNFNGIKLPEYIDESFDWFMYGYLYGYIFRLL